MKVRLEVIGVETSGDGIKVRCQGKPDRAAEWRSLELWTFTLPEYAARNYTIGRMINVEIKP